MPTSRPLAVLAAACVAASAMALDVSFPGGTVKEYFNALQAADPSLRLVVHPDVDWFEMPAVELTGISPKAAVEAAARLHQAIDSSLIPAPEDPRRLELATFVVTVDPIAIAAMTEIELQDTRFDIDFEGGTLGDLVRELRAEAGANIILDNAAGDVRIPELRFRNTTLWDLISTLERMGAGDRAFESFSFMGSSEGAIFHLRAPTASSVGNGTRVHSLAQINAMGTLEASEVLGALQTALDAAGVEAVVRYHEPTELLIVRGDGMAIDIAAQVVRECANTADRRANTAR